MNHGGTPDASSPPIIDPAEVPTMRSALAGSQPVSVARASRPPVSQAPPITPPAPSTSPTRGDRRFGIPQVSLWGGGAKDAARLRGGPAPVVVAVFVVVRLD